MSGLHDAFDEIVADVPVYGDLDRAVEQADRERRRTSGMIAGLAAAAAVVAVVVGLLVVTRGGSDAPRPIGPPAPTPTGKHSAIDRVLDAGPSEVLVARQVGRFGLDVAGKTVPGRWALQDSRRDVWRAMYFDDVGYQSPALWWGKGTTTHEVPGQRGGVAISQDARWIAWTRTVSGGYSGLERPWVMEVVDTSTGEVRWSRSADADAPEIGPLAVTNDGVVVFGHCLRPVVDIGGAPQCDDARIDVWAPRADATGTVPAEVTVEHGPPGTVAALTPLVKVTGAHNGLLVRDAPSGRPRYVHVDERGDVEVVATLPPNTAAVTADERFALLSTDCAERDLVCDYSVLPLDGGAPQPLPGLTRLAPISNGYDWPVEPYVVERADLIVVRDPGDARSSYPAVARCSLSQARCVRIRE